MYMNGEKKLKRSIFEMSTEVLGIIEKESVPTKIMFAANMSYNRFMIIIEGLEIVGLVKEMIFNRADYLKGPGRRNSSIVTETVLWKTNKRIQRRYCLTEKGRRALSLVKNLKVMMEGLEDEKRISVVH